MMPKRFQTYPNMTLLLEVWLGLAKCFGARVAVAKRSNRLYSVQQQHALSPRTAWMATSPWLHKNYPTLRQRGEDTFTFLVRFSVAP
eukprot:5377365-Amphidinium_carterae.1